jgi:DNA helicase-2/ATP-dependent DNA helicase PcrA
MDGENIIYQRSGDEREEANFVAGQINHELQENKRQYRLRCFVSH